MDILSRHLRMWQTEICVLGPDALGHHVSNDTELLLSTTYCHSQYNVLERCLLFWLWLPVQKVNE